MSKRWVEKDGIHALYFTPFYDEKKVAELSHEDDGGWVCSSYLLPANMGIICSDSLEEAKMDAEELVLEHFKDKRDYYQYLMDSFKGVQP